MTKEYDKFGTRQVILKPEYYKGFKIEFNKSISVSGLSFTSMKATRGNDVVKHSSLPIVTKARAFEIIKEDINKFLRTPRKTIVRLTDVMPEFVEQINDAFNYDDEYDLDIQVKSVRGSIKESNASTKEKQKALAYLNQEYKEHKNAFKD